MTASPEYREGQPIPGTQYSFVRELGSGGHGCVYEVEHTFLEARAVMKLLHADLVGRGDIASRMTREARTLAKLRHPNVVEVRDGGLTAEPIPRPYFVMEQLHGMPLREMLRKTRRSLGVLPALRIVTDVLVGLDHAHNAGVIHRDIKPDNVYLHRLPSGMTIAKVLDFGIAHLLLGQQNTGRYFLGTPRYAAPEQLTGETPTARTDVYAAGLVLYELLTGEMPFAKLKDVGALLNAHVNEALPKPSGANPDVPPSLDRFLESMLAKNAEDRPPTAFAAAVGLREIRSMYESAQSASVHAPEFKTEPSPMEDVLYAASPDDPRLVTEVGAPLGINDTTPDDALATNALQAALAAGEALSTTDLSPRSGAATAKSSRQVHTVPLAPPRADEPRGRARKRPPVDRAARTNTAREAPAPRAPTGPNDTIPTKHFDAALASTTPAPARGVDGANAPSRSSAATTSSPLVIAASSPPPNAAADRSRRISRRSRFALKVMALAGALAVAALSVTTLILRASREPASAGATAAASGAERSNATPSTASTPVAIASVDGSPSDPREVARPTPAAAAAPAILATASSVRGASTTAARPEGPPKKRAATAAPRVPSAVPFE